MTKYLEVFTNDGHLQIDDFYYNLKLTRKVHLTLPPEKISDHAPHVFPGDMQDLTLVPGRMGYNYSGGNHYRAGTEILKNRTDNQDPQDIVDELESLIILYGSHRNEWPSNFRYKYESPYMYSEQMCFIHVNSGSAGCINQSAAFLVYNASSTTPAEVDCYIFGGGWWERNPLSKHGAGIEIFDASGDNVFSSNNKNMKIIKSSITNIENTGTIISRLRNWRDFSYSEPTGRKYAVFTPVVPIGFISHPDYTSFAQVWLPTYEMSGNTCISRMSPFGGRDTGAFDDITYIRRNGMCLVADVTGF